MKYSVLYEMACVNDIIFNGYRQPNIRELTLLSDRQIKLGFWTNLLALGARFGAVGNT